MLQTLRVILLRRDLQIVRLVHADVFRANMDLRWMCQFRRVLRHDDSQRTVVLDGRNVVRLTSNCLRVLLARFLSIAVSRE